MRPGNGAGKAVSPGPSLAGFVQRAVRAAVQAAGDQQTDDLSELLSADIRTIQELLGHCDVNTMMVYSHVLNRGPSGLRSPADLLCGTE